MLKVALTISIIFASLHTAKVDSWAPPKTTTHYSANALWFVTIVPAKFPVGYFKKDKLTTQQKRKLTAADTTVVPCYAMMFKKTKRGKSLIWKKDLVNEWAPVDAFVSNDGNFLVTFDNWHSVGYGSDVMAYYDAHGDLIKQHALEDISPFPISSYRKSVSSQWWRCGVSFLDANRIQLCFEDENEKKEIRVYDLLKRGIE